MSEIRLDGLELWGNHGVLDEERAAGQRFLFDVALTLSERAEYSDRLEDTVDYREIVAVVREVSDSRPFHLLEALAAAVADALVERFPAESVAVSVGKPDVELGAPVARTAVTVARRRGRRAPAAVALGSNLGDREANLRAAIERLRAARGITVEAVSAFRETEPVGVVDQPRFVNAAVAVETDLSPRSLLRRLLEVERALGRTRDRETRYGPRLIDLDLLLYDELLMDEPGLTLPHPRLHERRFALEPLAEVMPGVVIPGHGPVETLLARLE